MRLGVGQGPIDPAATFGRDVNPYLAPVRRSLTPLDQARNFHPVDNLGHCGLALERPRREFADIHSVAVAEAGEDAPFRDLKAVLF